MVSGGKQANCGGKEAMNELKDGLKRLQKAGKDLQKAGCDKCIGPGDEAAAAALQQWHTLWERVNGTYNRLKAEEQALDFDDLELLAERLLDHQDLDPRLAAFRAGIHHLMVDEFQDTNEIQQRIIYALAHPREDGRLFVVGDPKQSIYRFRQAQASVFRHTADDIQAASGQEPLPLSRSFRAHEALVHALNDAFARVLQPLGDTRADYEAPPGPLMAYRTRPDAGANALPAVEFWLIPKKDGEDESISMEDARLWEARVLARRLHQLHETGFAVWDKGREAYRPFRYSDAAILFRATTGLPLYEEQFKAEGLPYLTVSGRGYYDRPEVRDLTALLACLRAPGDDLSLATVLRSPLFSLSDETLYRLRWRRPDGERAAEPAPYREALTTPPATDQPDRVAYAGGVLAHLWKMTGRVEVWGLLREALDRTGYAAAMALSGDAGSGGRQSRNVAKFLGLARERGGVSVSDFLLRVQDLRDREAREGEALANDPESGAVQLMSIHAAKGLEFSVVAVADLGRGGSGSRGAPRLLHDPTFGLVCQQRNADGDWEEPASYLWGKWLDQRMEEAESKRLLYVACTRAADLLILSGRRGGKGCWLESLLEAWQIEDQTAEASVVCRERYAIAVHRPVEPPVDDEGRAAVPSDTEPVALAVQVMPPLALPIPALERLQTVAVTALVRQLDAEQDRPPSVGMAVRGRSGGRLQVAPRYLIGNVIHRALADWECLVNSANDLERRLISYAREEGILSPESVADTVRRARTMLAGLRRVPLFAEISQAKERHGEVPFTLRVSQGAVHGVIDLLYRDERGVWTLVDWKTEWVRREEIAERAAQHCLQIAAYATAAQQALGALPRALLCFLEADAEVHEFPEEELVAVWQRLWKGESRLGVS